MVSWIINQYWRPLINSLPSRWAGRNLSHVFTYREHRSWLPILYTVIGGCTSLIVWRWRPGKGFVIWWLEVFFFFLLFLWHGMGLRSTHLTACLLKGGRWKFCPSAWIHCVQVPILSAWIRQRRRARFGCENGSHNEHNPPLMSKVEL